MRYVLFIAALGLLVSSCGGYSENVIDATSIVLSGTLSVPPPTSKTATIQVSAVPDVGTQSTGVLCSTPLLAGASSFECALVLNASSNNQFLEVAYLPDTNPNDAITTFVETDNADATVAVSSLSHLLSQRALSLTSNQTVLIASSYDSAQTQASTALGGIDVTQSSDFYEAAVAALAEVKGLSDPLVLSRGFAQDFRDDGVFDGKDKNGIMAPISGITFSASLWATDLQTQLQTLAANDPRFVGTFDPGITLTATPAQPRLVPFAILAPVLTSFFLAPEVAWSSALADSYGISVSTSPDGSSNCSGGDTQNLTVSGSTTSTQLQPLTAGQNYYLCIQAQTGGGGTESPSNLNQGLYYFRIAPDAQ